MHLLVLRLLLLDHHDRLRLRLLHYHSGDRIWRAVDPGVAPDPARHRRSTEGGARGKPEGGTGASHTATYVVMVVAVTDMRARAEGPAHICSAHSFVVGPVVVACG